MLIDKAFAPDSDRKAAVLERFFKRELAMAPAGNDHAWIQCPAYS